MAGVADHMALTGRTRLKRTMPFLMREGALIGETWITREVIRFVIRSHRRRVWALPTAMPVARCTVSAMDFWRVGSARRTETGTRFMRRESEVGAGRNALLLSGLRQLVVVWGIVACSVALGSR